MKRLLPYVEEYRDRHGKLRRYFRRRGSRRIPLPGHPHSPEFLAAYKAAIAGYVVPHERTTSTIGQSRAAPGSVDAAIGAYLADGSWRDELAKATQQCRRHILERFRQQHGKKRIALIQRGHISVMLGEKTPASARNWFNTIRGLMQFAVRAKLLDRDPTEGIERVKRKKTDGHHSWTDDEIAQYEAKHPIGSRARLAMALVLNTALRRADVVKLGPQHVRQGIITVRPQKTLRTTGVTLHIPVHPALADVLARTPTRHLTFLTTEVGKPKPLHPTSFSNKFRVWCDEAGLPHCSAHGLRKAQLRRLAEAGCSEHEIAAISGHSDLAEIRTYTKAVNQARLAQAAITRLRPEPTMNGSA